MCRKDKGTRAMQAGHCSNECVIQQNSKSPTRPRGKRGKEIKKNKVHHKVIITESPKEKMVKFCQFSGTLF